MPRSLRTQHSKKSRFATIFLGAPGCGKGTQAQLLSDTYGFYLLDTSKLLERKFHQKDGKRFLIADRKKYYFKDEKKIWEEGKLCSPPFVAKVLEDEVRDLFQRGEQIVFSGSPRTLYEAQCIIPLLISLYEKKNIRVIFLNLSIKESIYRNSHRKICSLMRHSIIHNKEMEKLTRCPLDGSKLVRRKSLDDPDTIHVRWKEFRERTVPVLKYLQESGVRVHKMSGSKSPEAVFRNVIRVLRPES